MLREIIVSISPEGEVEVSVKGHAGTGCKDLTRQLEAALGQTTADTKTAEYHLPEHQASRQRAGH
jgi:hypothetical protein